MQRMRDFFGIDKPCKHLITYQEKSIDIAGISIPNIFSLGKASINPQVLQEAEKAIKTLDLIFFQSCEMLKLAPNEEAKTKYYEQMVNQQQKLNDIAMTIAAYGDGQNNQMLEQTLTKTLEKNMGRAVASTQSDLPQTDETYDQNKINEKVDPVTLFELLDEKIDYDDLKVISLKAGINLDNISGDNRTIKMVNLVKKLEMRDKLTEFQELTMKFLTSNKI